MFSNKASRLSPGSHFIFCLQGFFFRPFFFLSVIVSPYDFSRNSFGFRYIATDYSRNYVFRHGLLIL